MYTVMIVDDEQAIRRGLAAKLNWESLGFRIAAEASNGEEALELLAREPVDLVITDVKMPRLDGIGLIERCRSFHPATRFIVLSGYDDFQYATAAMRHKAEDYLLKPVIRKELAERLCLVRKGLDAEREQASLQREEIGRTRAYFAAMREQFVLYAVKEDGDPQIVQARAQQLELAAASAGEAAVAFVSAEAVIPEERLEGGAGSERLLREAFFMLGRELAEIAGSGNAVAFHDPSYPTMLHVMVTGDADSAAAAEADRLAAALADRAAALLRIKVVSGTGRPVRGQSQWRQGYAHALLAWSRKREDGGAPAEGEPEPADVIPVSWEQEKAIILALETEDLNGFEGLVRGMAANASSYSRIALPMLHLNLLLLMEALSVKHGARPAGGDDAFRIRPEAVWAYRTKKEILEQLSKAAADLMAAIAAAREKTGSADTVETIRRYIDANYMLPLSLAHLAERYRINATYLSERFKQRTGRTFSEYLTAVRMEEAKRLLLEPRLRIADVYELVGFSDPGYFSQAFKKYTGMRPNEYRSACQRNS